MVKRKKKSAASRGPKRDHKRPSRTREEHIASLKWNIKDTEEALHNAVAMRSWSGIAKYAGQLQKLEDRLYRAQGLGPRRIARELRARPRTSAEYEAATNARLRGRRGVP